MPERRKPEDCRYRVEPRAPGEPARCGLVEQIAGACDAEATRVVPQTCLACCDAVPPSPERLNPVVASLLYVLTDELTKRGGDPKVDARRLAELQGWAVRNLSGAEAIGFAAHRPRVEGPCFHLGDPAGRRECSTPRGRVRVESFACHHPLHGQTTARECQACPDFDPRLNRREVTAWAVGVVTAPRQEPTLARCLESLAAAGWDAPRLFVEPGAEVPARFAHLPATRRESTLGEWPNWLLGLAELYQRAPEADAYLMVQDDTVFSRGVRAFLEADLWPAPRVGMVSVYCPEPYARPDRGWHPVEQRVGLAGALACILPNAAVRSLLCHPEVIEHRRRGVRHGLVDTDGVLGRWADREGLPIYHHSPSLAQHIGDTSTLWPGAPNSGVRHSSNFAGEDFDARDFLPRPADDPPPGAGGAWPAPRDGSGGARSSTAELLDPPLVSCIMPTADRREFVRIALELFRAQDYPRKELILVDDGDDPVRDLAESVPGVRYVRLEARATIGEKRNRACLQARGEVIVHWDDDDWYAPGRLRYQVAPIVADEADVTGLLGTHVLTLPGEFRTIDPDLHERMFFGGVHGGTLAYHRSLWDSGLRYPDANLGEDVGLLRQAIGSGRRLGRLANPGIFVYVRHGRNSWALDPGFFVDANGWSKGASPPGFPAAMLPALRRAADSRPGSQVDPPRPASGGAGPHRLDSPWETRVEVGGVAYDHALPARPAPGSRFEIGGRYARFRCRVAAPAEGPAGADFRVVGDGRLLAAAIAVAPDDSPRLIEADVRGVRVLELIAGGDDALWLDPALDAEPPVPGGGRLADCLGRAAIDLPAVPPRAERCIATVVSPGFAGYLDDMLGSLRANGGCPDAAVVVLAVDPDPECRRVAAKFGAALIPCAGLVAAGQSLKALLYSAARVVDAERFLCLDADMLVLGDLRPVFAALDACPEGVVLAVREGNGAGLADLDDALRRMYFGDPGDLARLTGGPGGEGRYPLVVNDGLFAAGRPAMLALDRTIRGWGAAPGWVDERRDVGWRNQLIFNLAVAHLDCGVELAPAYNIQLNSQDVEWAVGPSRPEARWRGGPVKVLHFNGLGRLKYPERKGHYARLADPPIAVEAPRTRDEARPDGAPAGPRLAPGPTGSIDLAKILAAVVVYDRHSTVSTWLRCWDASYRGRVPLAVCHTLPGDRLAAAAIRMARPDVYLPRTGRGGQDIAALRHVIRSAPGDWEALFWCTDDTIPMRRDFLDLFARRMAPGVGLVGLHFASQAAAGPIGPVHEHVRTGAFLIRREVAERLSFPAEAAGKRGCYEFEHADPVANLTAQVRALGYRVTSLRGDEPVAAWWELEDDPMWDVGHLGVHHPADVDGLWRRFAAAWGLPGPGLAAPRVLVLAHVFYEELWGELAAHLRRLPAPFDLAVNAVRGHVSAGWERSVIGEFPGARVNWSENRGMDIGGTIALLDGVDLSRYDLVCKVHTKMSAYDPVAGARWRQGMLRALFDDPAAVYAAFDDPAVAMLSSRDYLMDLMTVNRENCEALCRRLGLDPGLLDGEFVSGTMFWCRSSIFAALQRAGIDPGEFPGGYARDGTLAHAFERVFGVLARDRGIIVGR